MDHFEVKRALASMVILVDTREQDTPRLRKRLRAMDCPIERHKLEFGDYSARCTLPDGRELDLSDICAVERKMSLDEICACYCDGRPRFTREFERAKKAGAKVYLLIEGASWEKAYAGFYRSRMNPDSLVASLTAWLTRYNCPILFCEPETSGRLIRDLLYRELKERLEKMTDERAGNCKGPGEDE